MYNRLRAAQAEEGFSLVELLIVIVVLGVLSGIVVFGVGTFQGDSELAACKSDNKTYDVAASAYRAKFGPTATVSGKILADAGYTESEITKKTC